MPRLTHVIFAMLRLLHVIEATPASLMSQDEYAEYSAPLTNAEFGTTNVTLA